MKKKIFKLIYLFIFLIILSLIFSNNCCALTPKIVNKMSGAFEQIEKWLLRLATPATAMAVAIGLFMKKFSFGDEERIRISKKVIRGSIVSYCLLLTLDLILAAINSIIN